ncbi:hypothetical protein phiOC_p331 [Ochrobactrum phage vB_OspM_OC]|nr:hypothetical protein phiOC_p331 [Ochrobactrum phage vB_OspM_OC]
MFTFILIAIILILYVLGMVLYAMVSVIPDMKKDQNGDMVVAKELHITELLIWPYHAAKIIVTSVSVVFTK